MASTEERLSKLLKATQEKIDPELEYLDSLPFNEKPARHAQVHVIKKNLKKAEQHLKKISASLEDTNNPIATEIREYIAKVREIIEREAGESEEEEKEELEEETEEKSEKESEEELAEEDEEEEDEEPEEEEEDEKEEDEENEKEEIEENEKEEIEENEKEEDEENEKEEIEEDEKEEIEKDEKEEDEEDEKEEDEEDEKEEDEEDEKEEDEEDEKEEDEEDEKEEDEEDEKEEEEDETEEEENETEEEEEIEAAEASEINEISEGPEFTHEETAPAPQVQSSARNPIALPPSALTQTSNPAQSNLIAPPTTHISHSGKPLTPLDEQDLNAKKHLAQPPAAQQSLEQKPDQAPLTHPTPHKPA